MGDMQFNGTQEEWDALVKKNRQTTMKLYTEEQVRAAMAQGYDWCHQKYMPSDNMIEVFIRQLTPIEIPSDEEIKEGLFHRSNEYAIGFKDAIEYIKQQYK